MLIPGMWVSDSKGSDNHPSSLGSATGGTGQGVCTSSSLLGFGLLGFVEIHYHIWFLA